MWETRVQSLGWEDPLEKEMAIHSCPQNPMDKEAWWDVVHRVTKSQTQLKWLSTHAQICSIRWRIGRRTGYDGFAETESKVRPEQRKAELCLGESKTAHVWSGRLQGGGATFHQPPPEGDWKVAFWPYQRTRFLIVFLQSSHPPPLLCFSCFMIQFVFLDFDQDRTQSSKR